VQIHISGFSRIHSYPSTPRKKSIVCFKKTFFQHFCVWAAFSDLIYVCVCMCSKKKGFACIQCHKKKQTKTTTQRDSGPKSLLSSRCKHNTNTWLFCVCACVLFWAPSTKSANREICVCVLCVSFFYFGCLLLHVSF